jgi:hippurate hydrolase
MRRALLLSLPMLLSGMAVHAALKPGASAQIEAQTNKNWGELEALYKDLHSHPEVGFTEVRTAGILSEKLRKLGLR